MPCFHPLKGWLSRNVNPTGKRSIVFNVSDAYIDLPVTVPCGQCRGCRLERSREWAVRCVHEASLYKENCFITLTYNDNFLPDRGSLVKKHFQDFMKRLRKRVGKVRFFQCGEYGEGLSRPHFHACLFGYDFPDRVFFTRRNGCNLFTSAILSSVWPFGFSLVGDVTFESAAYVARYIMKKISGDKSDEHYGGKEPEYTTMSRRPGIGLEWFKKFRDDVFPHDFMVIRGGIKCKPSRYYDNKYDLTNGKEFALIKGARIRKALASPDNTMARLRVREQCLAAKLSTLRRGLENEA